MDAHYFTISKHLACSCLGCGLLEVRWCRGVTEDCRRTCFPRSVGPIVVLYCLSMMITMHWYGCGLLAFWLNTAPVVIVVLCATLCIAVTSPLLYIWREWIASICSLSLPLLALPYMELCVGQATYLGKRCP